MRNKILGVCVSSFIAVSPSIAGFTVYANNGPVWFQAVQQWTTIDFTGYPDDAYTLITNQYEHLGVHFIDRDGNWVTPIQPTTFPQDGHGLFGAALVEMTFDQGLDAFATHFPGWARFEFYSGGTLLFTSPMLGPSGVNHFAGFIADQSFDRVRIYGEPPDIFGNLDNVWFDNFYFSTVPAPGGALVLISISRLGPNRRRGA